MAPVLDDLVAEEEEAGGGLKVSVGDGVGLLPLVVKGCEPTDPNEFLG